MLLLEDGDSDPLDVILERGREKPSDMAKLLTLASNLVKAVAQMHRSGIIHKDIKPANILVNADDHVRLTGFGIASRKRRERQPPAPIEAIAGTFAYMAPEQTGRTSRSIDARSDLYALGVTLYELFTGSLPFIASDPIDWIHCHAARQALPPSERRCGLPKVIDSIILKLLAKNPEDRYQTATGVEHDLRRCLGAWLAIGEIDDFHVGENDTSDRLLIPERLYGREAEVEILLAAAQRSLVEGSSEMVLISGQAGIGKSSIIKELHGDIASVHGLFASGKFDQYKRDIPYSTLAQAFQGLVRQLLGKSNQVLEDWRTALLAALGSNGQLMVNLIPELALVIGDQPPVTQVDPQMAQARFHHVFRNLADVFARPDHPLVLFIDDLQWVDIATLGFLELLVIDPEIHNLLVIGAYRDNEVDRTHPLAGMIAEMRRSRAALSEITLGPLGIDDLAMLSADALKTDTGRTRELAELMIEKTAGNPFFAIQFITELAEGNLLKFNSEHIGWQWNISEIRTKGITNNVAHLMSARLERLNDSTRSALGQLACLGNAADTLTAALVLECSQERLDAILFDATESGLIARSNGSFAFEHDRVQEAAYALIPPIERAAAHLRIGRVLHALTPPNELEDSVYEIVNQFDRGASAIESMAERELAANLYFIAGKRAKASSAYASAKNYFSAGRALLGGNSWGPQYRLTFELELNQAECEIVAGELNAAKDRLALLAEHAEGLTDQAGVVCLSVLLNFTTGKSEYAVGVALAFLSRAGIEWTSRPTKSVVREEYLEMHRKLAQRPIATLVDLPAMTDPSNIAIMTVLTELFPAAYAVDRYLMELVLLRMTNLSLDHGHCEGSSVAYSALNMALGAHFADYTTAFQLGELACELVDRRGMNRYKARVYSCFAAFTMPWIKHLPLCQPMMIHAFQVGSSMGDMAFAAYNSRNLITHLLVSGLPLGQVQRKAEEALAFAKRIQLGLSAERFIGQLKLVQRLRGIPTEDRPGDEEWARQNVEGQPGLAMMVCYHWVFRLQERYFAKDYDSALEAAEHVEGIRWTMRSSIEEAEYDFYAALSHAAASDTFSGEQRERHVRELSKHYKRIVVWANNCPENFASRKALIGAEIARLEGRDLETQRLYEDAVRLARVHGFVQNEAVANELAGYFHFKRGLATIADAYLRNAHDCYQRWGGFGKVKQLEQSFPHLHQRPPVASLASTVDTPIARLNVEAVDKASQTLSSEMVLPTLLEKLLRLAVQHAGAERGLLILLHGGDPYVEAKASTSFGSVEVAVYSDKATSLDLPISVLQFVLRTHERLLLGDARVDGLDPEDEYVLRCRPRSVLCLPIFKKAKVIGVLYLENNLSTRAFAAESVAVLDFLASQAAIWLENARLYSDLQRSEAWLKEAQNVSSTGSFYWHVPLDEFECSDQTYRIHELDPGERMTLELIASRIHPEDLPLMQEMIETGRGPATGLDYVYRALMPDKSVKYLHLVAHPTRDKDDQVAYIGSIQDVTQRHLAEEALGRARSELAHATRTTTLGALTASIAHEVNQPLVGIVTNASTCLRMLAADPPNIEGARKTAERSIRDGNRAADVIKRLRALFGKKITTIESVDLNEATKEVIALSASELQKSRVSIQVELARNLPNVTGDRVQLQQVVLNLLLNAADSMIEAGNHPRSLIVKSRLDEDDHVCIAVEDSGTGIDPNNADRLFEAFYTTKAEGMGMGLSVSQSIIERHNGRLYAKPNDGPGATFSFSIPREAAVIAPLHGPPNGEVSTSTIARATAR